MKPLCLPLAAAVFTLLLATSRLAAQGNFAPPKVVELDDATRQTIKERGDRLRRMIFELQRQGVRDPILAEIEIYAKAAEWIVRHNEFYQKDSPAWTVECLDRGLLRASQAARGESPWLTQAGVPVARAYRSRVDGSVQPYAAVYPVEYGRDPRKSWRIDVILHGRDSGLTEVKFLKTHDGSKPAPEDLPGVQLHIFGRTNNAYRWAGETDVFEAIENFLLVERSFGRDQLLDTRRTVLRGFSMGGAGTWHIGLHRPDRWAVIGPGAGFTTTHGYIKSLPEKLPSHQEACLRIYDAVEYAENAFNVPVVAYSGSEDPQKQAADTIEARLKMLGIPMTHLVAPGLGHSLPAEWQKKLEAEYLKYAGPGKGRPESPERVRFVTHTLKYPSCEWIEVLLMDRHYESTKVDAKRTNLGYEIKTANVAALRLSLGQDEPTPGKVDLDGQEVPIGRFTRSDPSQLYFEKGSDGRWGPVLPQKLIGDRTRNPRKVSRLTGPIDDAFTDSFLVVRPGGDPWHERPHDYVEADIQRFSKEWHKFLRGELPVKDDAAVTDEDILTRHLVLFGDPGSNSLMAQCLGGLPLTWTKTKLVFAGKEYDPATHLPVLIFPNPLNPNRYVVINSGHTFHEADFRGTNALLYPRLGDFAVLKLGGASNPLEAEPVAVGLFDDHWKVPAKEGR